MKLVTFATQKGGSCKSTLTTLAATTLANDFGYRVLVLDADPQQSLYQLRAVSDEQMRDPEEAYSYQILPMALSEALNYLEENADNYDVVFIDLPGRSDTAEAVEILASCNVVIVPLITGMFDRLSTSAFMDGLLTTQKTLGDDTFAVYGLRAKVRNGTREEQEINDYLATKDFPMFASKIASRECYVRPSTLYSYLHSGFRRSVGGNTVVAQEVLAFCEEFIQLVGLPVEEESTEPQNA